MNWAARQGALGEALAACRPLWHAQPFCEVRPAWSAIHPALTAELLALDDAAAEHFNGDGAAARGLVARHVPQVAVFDDLLALAPPPPAPAPEPGRFWDWEIPGRKRSQIVAFAGAARPSGRPLLDWCAGKGHLGRLLALHWQVPATSLDRDATLCAEGEALARRSGATQRFVTADALQAEDRLGPDQHVVALHACGDLHRHALVAGAERGVAAFDLAPCCYHRGVLAHYRPLAATSGLALTRDDLRLAVTETVTASARLARQRDRAMAWKLGFDAWRRSIEGDAYRPFRSLPASWLRLPFAECCAHLSRREGLPAPGDGDAAACEAAGWRRQREVLRLSILRHAFRRALEVWLVGDLAVALEEKGYRVAVHEFCPRAVTPRNLLLSARR